MAVLIFPSEKGASFWITPLAIMTLYSCAAFRAASSSEVSNASTGWKYSVRISLRCFSV